ncbi:MAG: hypothetical protein IJB97_05495 [Clostridia bacterium]|nr:hypothetical protein [Clostridia bacterium]
MRFLYFQKFTGKYQHFCPSNVFSRVSTYTKRLKIYKYSIRARENRTLTGASRPKKAEITTVGSVNLKPERKNCERRLKKATELGLERSNTATSEYLQKLF